MGERSGLKIAGCPDPISTGLEDKTRREGGITKDDGVEWGSTETWMKPEKKVDSTEQNREETQLKRNSRNWDQVPALSWKPLEEGELSTCHPPTS